MIAIRKYSKPQRAKKRQEFKQWYDMSRYWKNGSIKSSKLRSKKVAKTQYKILKTQGYI